MPELPKGTIVFITGTPGTGKTTIARTMADVIGARYLNPASLLGHEGIDYAHDRNRRTRIVSPERLRNSVRSLSRVVSRGLVIDSHLAFEVDPPLRLQRAIVLRCNPIVLEKRLRRKRWSRRKIGENLLAEILDICLYDAVQKWGYKKITEIDTTSRSPGKALKLAIRALEQSQIQKRPKVDWLKTLKHQRMLSRYLLKD